MNTSETQWKKSTFISAAHVLHRPRSTPRRSKRLTGIVRGENVKLKVNPVVIGAKAEKIQLSPNMQDGQIKALRVNCACGCESTFDIQYGAGGTNHDIQNSSDNVHAGSVDHRMQDTNHSAA